MIGITEEQRTRAELAQGKLEAGLAESSGRKERMDTVAYQSALDKLEEDTAQIERLLQRGVISEEEARRLRTRAKMHNSDDHPKRQQDKKVDDAKLAASGLMTADSMILEALRVKKTNWFVTFFRKLFRSDKLEAKIAAERRRRADPAFKHPFPFLYNLVNEGMGFEMVMFSLVGANSLLTGIQISAMGGPDQPGLRVLEELFTIAFVVEIVVRVIADGWLWFFDLGNCIDFVLIAVTGVVPTFLGSFLNLSDNPVLRVSQALRAFRLVRILRRVRARFSTLWSLVNGILSSGLVLLWTGVLMCVLLYMFAVLGVALTKRYDLQFDSEQQAVVDTHFADVLGGMFTLFQVITLDSWTGISRPLHGSYPIIGVYFVAFVAVGCMILNNLVVAVICANAFKTVEDDQELQAAFKKQEIHEQLEALAEIFESIDVDGSDKMGREEYEHALTQSDGHKIVNKLKIANLDDDEIKNLWDFLDFPQEINCAYWSSQIRSLKGEVKAKDSFRVSRNLKKLTKRIERVSVEIEKHKFACETIKRDVVQCTQQLAMAMADMRQFLGCVTRCMPLDGIPMTRAAAEAFNLQMAQTVDGMLQPMLDRYVERSPLPSARLEKVFALPGRRGEAQAPPPLSEVQTLQLADGRPTRTSQFKQAELQPRNSVKQAWSG
eukprot:TRINITY_DN41174_c0_g1_i1.p1 TRINITY_DN41174_c0_g1~~TRINITY_DN41174_c0_g1_i1.p1  ORF type:complete len:663 (+),score=124.43 TRINITY_DN41174_c0_g1_i1:97-2085(+)